METGRMYSDLPVEKQRTRRSDSSERHSRRSRSRSREREWDRGKDRMWEQDRDRGRSRYRDRDHDRDHSYRSRSRERDRDYSYKRDNRDRSRERDYSNKKSDYSLEMTAIIMLRNMKPTVRKEDISRALGSSMSFVRDIRLIQKKDGMNGFAFLEFYKVEDAVKWMEENKESFCLLGDHVDMEYCKQRKGWDPKESRRDYDGDWACFKCSTLNFSRRRLCMTCDCPRTESESLHEDVREGRIPKADDRKTDGDGEECTTSPTNVLIFRGLDALTTEEAVREAIRGVCDLCLKDVRLIKEKATNTSRGFCFVELSTVEEATSLLEIVQQQYPALFIDGKRVVVNYARQYSTPKVSTCSVASAAIAQAQWSMTTKASGSSQQPQKKNSLQQANQQDQKGSAEQYPSTYSYDETSGMYYDSATGLYYDPNTQYHYNNETGLYCYYDATQQAYISVNQDGNPLSNTQQATSSTTATAKGSKAKKTDKSLNAKKIAKDMARWAKNVNAAKSAQQQQLQAVIQQERTETVSETATAPDMGVTTLSSIKRTGVSLASALAMNDSMPALSSQMMETSEPPHRVPLGADANPAHTDWSQLACLLCQRKFSSKEMLVKHQQFSDLHKQNLRKSMQNSALPVVPAETEEVKYRDRAKERRDKFGTPAVIPGWKKRLERELVKEQSIPHEEPTKEGIKQDNVGNKMLQAMGWSEGEGLGRAKQGIVEPIQAERRTASAGLGSAGSKYASLYSSGGSYRETLKQLTKARFDDTFRT